MSRWILIALIILNIYIFLNISSTSRIEMARTIVQIPSKVGSVIYDISNKVDELK